MGCRPAKLVVGWYGVIDPFFRRVGRGKLVGWLAVLCIACQGVVDLLEERIG